MRTPDLSPARLESYFEHGSSNALNTPLAYGFCLAIGSTFIFLPVFSQPTIV